MKRKRKKEDGVFIRGKDEISKMRIACSTARDILLEVSDFVKDGVSTFEVDNFAEKLIKQNGCSSAFLGYKGFPGNICISLNEEVVHGIGSSKRIIHTGDLVKIDVGVKKNGWIGDNALTVPVGGKSAISDDDKRLLFATEESLDKAVSFAKDGEFLGNLCHSIEKNVKSFNCTVVKDLVGHGVGRKLHEEPAVPNYGIKNSGLILKSGMILAIEPMVNLGKSEVYTDTSDKWTVLTKDRLNSAHFEFTVLVSRDGGEVLTKRDRLTDDSWI